MTSNKNSIDSLNDATFIYFIWFSKDQRSPFLYKFHQCKIIKCTCHHFIVASNFIVWNRSHIFNYKLVYHIYIEYLLWYHMEKEEMSSPLLNYSIYSILILFMHYIFLHPLCNSLLWMTFFWQIGWRLRQEWDNYCMKDIYYSCLESHTALDACVVHGTIEYVWIM